MIVIAENSSQRLFILLAVLLSGCSANHYAIHEVDPIGYDGSVAIAVGAKQRLVLTNLAKIDTNTTTGTGNAAVQKTKHITLRRYCAEPSPDVFTVLGQSASGGLSYGHTADPKSLNAALQGALSSTESGSTISRTQTINMLKEMMYRTCESYLNGQISDDEYPIIAARDQRIMTSILAIEQLTGVVQPKPIAIASTANASTGQTSSEAILALEKAKKEVDDNKGAVKTAQDAFSSIDDPAGACDALKAKKDGGSITNKEQTTLDSCNDKRKELDAAKKKVSDAQDYYDHLAALANKPGMSSSTTNALVLASPPATTASDLSIEHDRTARIKAVSDTVKEIVLQSFKQQDETAFFCYRAITSISGEQADNGGAADNGRQDDKNVKDACLEFITARVQASAAAADRDKARLTLEAEQATQQLEVIRKQNFEPLWDRVKGGDGKVNEDKLNAILGKEAFRHLSTPMKDRVKSLAGKSKEEAMKIFKGIPLWLQNELLNN
jgi:hypothetical protein